MSLFKTLSSQWATLFSRGRMRTNHKHPVGLHYREDVGRADAKWQHAIRRLERAHHSPVAFQHEPRRTAGARICSGEGWSIQEPRQAHDYPFGSLADATKSDRRNEQRIYF